MSNLLTVAHLSCAYGRQEIVHDANLSVGKGEFCALLGLNGCGKTTLIKSICGLLPITQGQCFVNEENCTHMNERQRALRMSYIPQRGSPLFGKSVLDVVLMGYHARLQLLESPGEKCRKQALETLEHLGLQDFARHDYATLSEGQKQLVILARTLVQDAPVMLMDEPDSALDFVNRTMVLDQVRNVLQEQGKAGLIALHDPNFAMAYCDRLLLMKNGTIAQELTLENTSREEVGAALSQIYGEIRVLEHQGRFVMVHA